MIQGKEMEAKGREGTDTWCRGRARYREEEPLLLYWEKNKNCNGRIKRVNRERWIGEESIKVRGG